MSTPMTMDAEEKWIHDSMLFKELIGSMGWDRHVGYLAMAEQEATESFIATGEKAEYLRGYVMGLRWAATHPQRVIDKVKERT